MLGTPAYMAPEQVTGAAIDARTDLYAMGVVLHHLLTAQLPFAGRTPLALAESRLHDQPTPVGDQRDSLPAWIADVVTRALAREPADRFQTAAEFSEALKRGLAGRRPMAPSPRSPAAPLPEELVMTVAPARAAAPLTGDVEMSRETVISHASGTPLASASTSLVVAAPASASRAESPAAPAGRPATAMLALGAVVVLLAAGFGVWAMTGREASPPPPDASTASPPATAAAADPASSSLQASGADDPPATVGSEPLSTPTPATPPVEAAPPAGAAPAPPRRTTPAPVDGLVTFRDIRYLAITGRRGEDRDAALYVGGGQVSVMPRGAGQPFATLRYEDITATYARSRGPRSAPGLAGPPADLDLPGGFLGMRGARHWLVLQTAAASAVLTLDDETWSAIVDLISERTGRPVRRGSSRP
jgi:serine/threonine-protein kinase